MATKTQKVGNVKVSYLPQSDLSDYSDGDAESQLLEIFKSKKSEAKRRRLLRSKLDWPLYYHLAYERENLLNWYPFKKNARLLEVGAGCGALTGILSQKCKYTTALELTERRAMVAAHRHSSQKNLEIVVGNFEDYQPKEKFDYVTVIGVLEYAPSFVRGPDPQRAFLDNCRELLAPGGTLILAIENKLGLKYWAGAREDHTWRFFDSIQSYPFKSTAKTLSRNEMADLLSEAGFDKQKLYYPLPDYKLPREIFSDEYQPSLKHFVSPTILPTPTPDAPREHLFHEELVLRSVVKAGLFEEFANSFLVFAEKSS